MSRNDESEQPQTIGAASRRTTKDHIEILNERVFETYVNITELEHRLNAKVFRKAYLDNLLETCRFNDHQSNIALWENQKEFPALTAQNRTREELLFRLGSALVAKRARICTLEEQATANEVVIGAQKKALRNLLKQLEQDNQLGEKYELQKNNQILQKEREALQEVVRQFEAEAERAAKRSKAERLLDCVYDILGWTRKKPEPESSVFPFLKLPGELRNRIYVACLVSPYPIDFWPILPQDPWARGTKRLDMLMRAVDPINPGLLRVCRQVHHEAVHILYGSNRFRFSERGGWAMFCGFVHHIKLNSQHITNVSITYPEFYSGRSRLDFPPRGEDSEAFIDNMNSILRRLGRTNLDTAAGPHKCQNISLELGYSMLVRLPALKHFTLIVQHDVHVQDFGMKKSVKMFMGNSLSLQPGLPLSSPAMTFVFLRRDLTKPKPDNPWWAGGDLDDEDSMGRNKLRRWCRAYSLSVKSGFYGGFEDGVSYFVDGREYGDNIAIPEFQQPGPLGFTFIRALRRAFDIDWT